MSTLQSSNYVSAYVCFYKYCLLTTTTVCVFRNPSRQTPSSQLTRPLTAFIRLILTKMDGLHPTTRRSCCFKRKRRVRAPKRHIYENWRCYSLLFSYNRRRKLVFQLAADVTDAEDKCKLALCRPMAEGATCELRHNKLMVIGESSNAYVCALPEAA